MQSKLWKRIIIRRSRKSEERRHKALNTCGELLGSVRFSIERAVFDCHVPTVSSTLPAAIRIVENREFMPMEHLKLRRAASGRASARRASTRQAHAAFFNSRRKTYLLRKACAVESPCAQKRAPFYLRGCGKSRPRVRPWCV